MTTQAVSPSFPTNVPVLIVGGGPVGLTTALLLRRQGIPTLVVERHTGTAIHPRARGLNVRTMEIFRSLGLTERITAAGAALAVSKYHLWAETLTGREIRRVLLGDSGNRERTAHLSASRPAGCAQDELEPILLEAAHASGTDVRYGIECTVLTEDASGVIVTVRDRETGAPHTVHAAYVVAADGAGSPMRAALGVEATGPGILAHNISIYFRADLRALVRDRWFILCFIEHPDARGVLLSVNNTDRWVFSVTYDLAQGVTQADFPPERCIALVRQAIGLPDLPVELLSVLPWEAAGLVANRFALDRIFFAGDAAHVMPPAGAFGMNTGIQDAHNLAWKLAAVLHGVANPSLLATYDAERRPIAAATVANAVESGRRQFVHATAGISNLRRPEDSGEESRPLADPLALTLGYWYASTAVREGAPAFSLDALIDMGLIADGRPGTRAPHVWIEREGTRMSILDLFGTGFVLLAGAEGDAWRAAAQRIAVARGLSLDAYTVGPHGDLCDEAGAWQSAYGVSPSGAALVRPDGFVAWRWEQGVTSPDAALTVALDRVLGAREDTSERRQSLVTSRKA